MVADIHCGPDRDTQLGSRAPTLLDELVIAARAFDAHCIVDLGDRINSVAHGQDRVRTVYVRRRLQEAAVPVYHVVGNTDVARLSKDELTVALDKPAPHEIVDLDDVRLVLLDSLDPPIERTGGAIGEAQRAWLETALHTERPCVVFCHHPLDEQPLDGHRYFEARPHLAGARARAEVRRAFERAGCVRAVFAGHMHWTRLTQIGAVPYLTLASLVDCAYTGGEPCNAYALVAIEADRVDVSVMGLRPERLSLTTHPEARGG
ncbi:MAG TPA: metallophosphoesterase [bacterium]|nr:metallophosphoesterase [bacterium]